MTETNPQTQPQPQAQAQASKWWGESVTIWGALITGLATVLPALGPLVGLDITADLVRQFGDQVVRVVQAVAGLAGTIAVIWGRARATTPLVRREVTIQL